MSKLFKIIGGLLFLLILAVAGLAVFIATLDANKYKPQIQQAVLEQTGRDLDISGDIDFTLFPILGISLGKTTLSQPKNFGSDKPFLSFSDAVVGLEVTPLLSKSIEVSQLIIKDAVINATVSKSGAQNWVFEPGKKPAEQNTDTSETKQKGEPLSLSVRSIEITNAQVNFQDHQKNAAFSLSPLNLKVAGLQDKGTGSVNFDGLFTDLKTQMGADVKGSMSVNPDLSAQIFNIKNTNVTATLKGKDILNGELPINVKANAVLNLKSEDLSLTDLDIDVAGQKLSGEATVSRFATPLIKFSLKGDSFDADSFLPKPVAKAEGSDKVAKVKKEPAPLPFDALKTIQLQGDAAIKTLKIANMNLTDFAVNVGGGRGVIALQPISFKAYGGLADINTIINASGAVPALDIVGKLSNFNMGEYLQASAGDAFVDGLVNIDFDLRGSGKTDQALINSLSGRTGFDFGEGVIRKWQLSKVLNNVLGFLQNGTIQETGNDNFAFTSAIGKAVLTNGVIKNDDFLMKAPLMDIKGSGIVSLPANNVNYTLEPQLGEQLLAKSSVRSLPIHITGSLDAPSYKFDVQAALKGKLQEKASEALDGQLGDKLDKALGEGTKEKLKELLPF